MMQQINNKNSIKTGNVALKEYMKVRTCCTADKPLKRLDVRALGADGRAHRIPRQVSRETCRNAAFS